MNCDLTPQWLLWMFPAMSRMSPSQHPKILRTKPRDPWRRSWDFRRHSKPKAQMPPRNTTISVNASRINQQHNVNQRFVAINLSLLATSRLDLLYGHLHERRRIGQGEIFPYKQLGIIIFFLNAVIVGKVMN